MICYCGWRGSLVCRGGSFVVVVGLLLLLLLLGCRGDVCMTGWRPRKDSMAKAPKWRTRSFMMTSTDLVRCKCKYELKYKKYSYM